jgi:hypothetical protein
LPGLLDHRLFSRRTPARFSAGTNPFAEIPFPQARRKKFGKM